MKVFYRDLAFEVDSGVYYPREDTFLFAYNLKVKERDKVLEIGTGCGILSILCSMQGADVTGVDINKKAVKCSQKNAEKHEVKIDFKKGNLFEPVKNEKFDIIIFNPPYLPGKRKHEEDSALIDSGEIEEFLEKYRKHLKENGRAFLIISSLTETEVKGKVIAEKKLPFEKLFLIELEK